MCEPNNHNDSQEIDIWDTLASHKLCDENAKGLQREIYQDLKDYVNFIEEPVEDRDETAESKASFVPQKSD